MKYISIVSYFKAREKHLPDDTDFERMIGSPNLKKAMGVLQDTYYASFVSQMKDFSLNELLQKEESFFKQNLRRIGLSTEAIDFLYLKENIFNLGLVLKHEMFRVSINQDSFSPFGIKKTDQLKEKYSSLIEYLKHLHPKNQNKIDEILTKLYFQKSIELSKKFRARDLQSFFQEYLQKFKNLSKENKIETFLHQLEQDFIEKTNWKISGLAAVFSYFLKRKRAQKKLRAILSAKQLELNPDKINQLSNNLPALV